MSDQPRTVEEIFHAARQIASEEDRAAYLDDICGDDATLRERVEVLLGAHFQADDFLESPALASDVTEIMAPLTEQPGMRIGRYKLLEQIGEGGFGVVYMAEQEEPVRRKVALKIIKLGMDTKQVIARFEAERQALAMMEHPSIARVLDAGATDTGRPYFVMELVRGIPITDYCDRSKLSTQERLDLFVQVCRAVQHAHQKGIIHRDIKPSNVLVTLHDVTAVPKIIDFGIAKATSHRLTEKTLFTEFRQFIGTPEYMSPDQAAISGLDVDTRTDIYSLGVLLYELLTGSTPFDSKTLREASYAEILRIIREVEPPRPSARVSTLIQEGQDIATPRHVEPSVLRKLVRGDLDWIVMKAMDKDRTRRYETANELAGDIQRYLSSEPVLATPPTVGYKLQKFVRRHRVGVMAGAVVTAALVVGLSLATYGLHQAWEEAARSQRIADFLEELFISTNPDQAMRRDADVEVVLENAREYFGEDHATVAAVLSSRALQLQSAGQFEAAEAHYRESLRIWSESEGADNINVADCHRALGLLRATVDDYEAAEASYRESIRISRALGGENLMLADTLTYLADAVTNQGKHDEGVALLKEALGMRRRVAPDQRLQIALVVSALVNTSAFAGHDDELPALLEEMVAAWREAAPPDGTMMARVLTEISMWYFQNQYNEKTAELADEALGIYRGMDAPPPQSYWTALAARGGVHERQDELAAVVPLTLEAVKVANSIQSTPDSTSRSFKDQALRQLADTTWALVRDPERSAEEYEIALDGVERYVAERPDVPAVLNTLGVAQFRTGHYEDALVTLAKSDAHFTEEEDGIPHDVAFMAMAHHQLGHEEEASAAMDRLRELMQKPKHANRDECLGFLEEAESMIYGSDTEARDGEDALDDLDEQVQRGG